jgi:capsular polysaccharide biosynthesis protein
MLFDWKHRSTIYSDTRKSDALMELGQYLLALLRWLWLILLSTLVAGVLSYVITVYTTVPLYRATTTLMVKSIILPGENSAADLNTYDTFLANEYMTATFRELAQKRPVLDLAAQTLGIDAAQLAAQLTIDVIPKTPLLTLSYSSPEPAQAVTVANGMAEALRQVTQDLQWMPGREIVVVEAATSPQIPVSPRLWLNTLVAAVAGCAFTVIGVLIVESLRHAAYRD